MAGSGPVVTAAGLVFAFTMATMAVSDLIVIGQVGTTIAIGLIFDTFVIRGLMTPSVATARVLITAFAEERQVPVENLLTPDYLRRVLWKPPAADSTDMETAVGEELATLGARPWQIEITAPILTTAILDPKPAKVPEQGTG